MSVMSASDGVMSASDGVRSASEGVRGEEGTAAVPCLQQDLLMADCSAGEGGCVSGER